MTSRNFNGRGFRPLPRLLLFGALVALPLAACDTDKLLEVVDPEFASPESLENDASLPTLVAGALGDFQVSYSGAGGDAFLSVVAVFTDEFYSAGTFTTRTATDQRDQFPTVQGNTSDGTYNGLHRARRSLFEAAGAVERIAGTTDARYSRLKALEGFTYIALGEAYCSNIPFSESAGGSPGDPGQPLSTSEVFAQGISKFDAALSANAGYNLAAVGKGRALLDQGNFQDAAAAVAGVPTGFIYFIEHSNNSGRQQNPIFSLQDNGRYSMSDNEGGNGLPYRSAMDPRLPWVEDPAGGFDATIPLFINMRYPDFGSDVPLADGIEARLIEAEAALQRGDTDTWLSKLNGLRADVAGLMAARYDSYSAFVPGPNNPTTTLDPLTDPGSEAARVDLMFRERAFWMYTTGHRLGDLRRLIRQYGRSASNVFPTGNYFKGGVFGNDVNFPIDFDEGNNPNFTNDLCDTKAA